MIDLTIWGMIILIPTGLFLLYFVIRCTVGKEDPAVITEYLKKGKGVDTASRDKCRRFKPHQHAEFLAFLPISFSAFALFAFHRGFFLPLDEKARFITIVLSNSLLFLLLIFIAVYLYAVYWTKEFHYKAAVSIKPKAIEMLCVYSIAVAEWFAMAVPLYFTGSAR